MSVGYPDGTRVSQAQDLQEAWTLVGNFNTDQSSPAIYLGNHTCLVGSINIATGAAQLSVDWFADQALTAFLGVTSIGLNSVVSNFAALFMVAGGPWAQIVFHPDGGTTSRVTAGSFFLGTQYRPERLLSPSVTSLEGGGTVGHLAVSTIPLQVYSSGRHAIHILGGTQGVKVEVDYYNNAVKAWTPITLYTVAANVHDYREILLPPAAVRLVLTDVSNTTDSTGVEWLVVQEV